MDKRAIDISGMLKCPIFGGICKEILSRDWKITSKKIEEITASLDKYIGMSVEPINKTNN